MLYFGMFHFNFYEFGIIGKLVTSPVRWYKNLNFFKRRQDVPFVVLGHIYLKRRLRSPAILFFHHRETFLGKLPMFGNCQCSEIYIYEREGLHERTVPCVWCDGILLWVCGENGRVKTLVTAQLTHTLLFVPFWTGHVNCRFTPKVFPWWNNKMAAVTS